MSDLSSGLVDRLRGLFETADYTVDGVAERLGSRANAALARNETTLAYRRTSGGDPLDTLIRLFLLQRPVPGSLLDKEILHELLALGIIVAQGDEVVAAIDVRPFAEDDRAWWVVADPTPGLDGRRAPIRSDYVLGIARPA